MYSRKEKPKQNKGMPAANYVAQKKSNRQQGLGFVNNRSETMALESLQLKTNHNLVLLQRKHAIEIRKRLNKKVTSAIRLIQNGGPVGKNATKDEVQAHDSAMNPGQHHQMRTVKRSNLIADLQQRKLDHANNNIRDTTLRNKALKNNEQQQAAQL